MKCKLIALTAFALMTACSGGGSDPSNGTTPPIAPADRFAAVDAAMQAAHNSTGNPAIGLSVYDRNGVKVFERMYGAFAVDQRVAIASASKMVAGVVLLRLVDKGFLSLDSTTGAVLGWTGPNAAITLRHLLSFTSGLPAEHTCTLRADITLAECVNSISLTTLTAAPGTLFDYGSTHLQVAARMAEVVTGNTWNQIFSLELLQPLGLPNLTYYTYPRQAIGIDNPLVAGGLRASMNEYARILQFTFDRGRWQGNQLMSAALFDLQAIEPYPAAAIGNSPAQSIGFNFRYGLTAWLECATPQTGCTTISSPGAFGFTPWLDRQNGYFAVLGMELDNSTNGIVSFAVNLEQQLQPLIVTALAQ